MVGFDRITFSPDILGGKARIRGMRIPVSLIISLLANGMTREEIIAEYPDLEPADIQECLRYAAWATDERIVGIPGPCDVMRWADGWNLRDATKPLPPRSSAGGRS